MPRPPATSSRWRLRGSTSNGRPSGPSRSIRSPGRRRVNQSVPRPMTRKWIVTIPVDGVGRVQRERPAQDDPRVVARAHVHELAGTRAVGQLGCVVRLQPLARQDLPALDELRGSQPHGHAVGSALGAVLVGLVLIGWSTRPRPHRRPRPRLPRRLVGGLRRILGGHGRERLGERVGEVAEHVGRVVELDELLGAGERPPLAVGVLGDDLGAEVPLGSSDQPLVVVVDDDQVADLPRQPSAAVRTAREARLAALAATPGNRARGRTAGGRRVSSSSSSRSAGWPRPSRRPPRHTGPRRPARSPRAPIPATSNSSSAAVGSTVCRQPRALPPRRPRRRRRVVQLDELRPPTR